MHAPFHQAIAISRNYLTDDNIDLSFQPAFRHTDRSKKSLALYMAKMKVREGLGKAFIRRTIARKP